VVLVELHLELCPNPEQLVATVATVAAAATMSSQFELAQNPTEPISSVTFSPRTPTRLLVSSWDRHVYLYDTHAEPGGKLLHKFEHRAPKAHVQHGRDDNEAFSAGLDWEVRRYARPQ
jgi:cell cycle arrest protein BUB3